MPGFKGQAENSIDGKGRVPVPAPMRRALRPEANETFVATRGLERCVFLYPADEWERMEAQFRTLNPFQAEARSFLRVIGMWANEVPLDKQGRIRVPEPLAEFAGLNLGGKAQIIGAFDRIEIWDPEAFRAHLNEQTADYETLAERVMGGVGA